MGRPLVPAYYWAGRGSAIIHRLKGFTYGVDADAYRRAYDPETLAWLRDTAGVNFLFLTYNWGLPPEIEEHDWSVFESTTEQAHALGMKVAAYLQLSNAAALGSYRARDWWALTPAGRRIPYYNGRYFTCLNHPDWRATVLARTLDCIDRGADAVFFDNCAFGAMPIPLAGDFTAFAGCYCDTCHQMFADSRVRMGRAPAGIPAVFRPRRDPVSRDFARWRASTLTTFIRELADAAREHRPGTVVLTNTFGAVNVGTYNLFGVDLPKLAGAVDWLFVENLQRPRLAGRLLVQNAGTFKLLGSLRPEAAALVISYDKGTGVDGIPPPRVFERTAAEGYAAGGVPVLRMGEYIERNCWALLGPGKHDPHLAAWRRIVRFVEAHPELFRDRRSAATVAVYVPPDLAWGGDVLPDHGSDFLRVTQALVAHAVPFRVVTAPEGLAGVRVLLAPAALPPPAEFDGTMLTYANLGLLHRSRVLPDYFAGPLEPLLRSTGPWWVNGYFHRMWVRRLADRSNLLFRSVFLQQSTIIDIAPPVLALLRAQQPCYALPRSPVSADLWRTPGRLALHLVNYADEPVQVKLVSATGPPSRVVGPDGYRTPMADGRLVVDSYVVAEWADPGQETAP